jgi:hypothetical protein
VADAEALAALAELERTVRRAFETGDDAELRILGYGEITLVLGSPADQPTSACKRLPVFRDARAAAAYRAMFDRYLHHLGASGVVPVPSELVELPGPEDTVVAYVVQPVLSPASLAPEILRAAEPDPDHPVLAGICAAVPTVVDDRNGLDGQVSNWALLDDGQLAYLDVTTPMLFDANGRTELDLDLFLAAYPWLLRPPIGRFVAPDVIGAYRYPHHVLLDLAGNLLKERLEPWLPAAVTAANRLLDRPISEDEARRYYRSDARLWELMLRLRRADRWWQRRVRRRPYPFLLPGPVAR